MPYPYISRVVIKNFRNFISVDISTASKQVVFGENDSGKTNYLFALQLILDLSLSDDDRCLSTTDFNNSITDPVESRSEILISLFLSDFEESKTILAQLSDAVVTSDGKRYIKLTYKYFPEIDAIGQVEYKYSIFKGDDENSVFGSRDRRYLQLKVVKPLRDVEYELRNHRISPLSRLLAKYDIPVERLSKIADEMHSKSNALLSIDELNDLATLIRERLIRILGQQASSSVEFAMADIDASKVLHALKIMLSGRLLEEKSLGIKNVLYIVLLLLQFHDEGVPTLIRQRDYANYSEKDATSCLVDSYEKTPDGNYRLANWKRHADLVHFFRENQQIGIPEVIIAIEEPEAHLHPILQRLLFRDIVFSSMHSVILTTHSTHIASVSPIDYMVHILQTSPTESKINAFEGLELKEKEKLDIERYLDVSRGEVYFGKGVILVEGIAEQYLVPRFAELMRLPLDKHGLVVCGVNSTNFLPYSAFLAKLSIPHVVLTDGDFYYENPDGERVFGILRNPSDPRKSGYFGVDTALRILDSRGVSVNRKASVENIRRIAERNGIFLGEYTFEIDIYTKSIASEESIAPIVETYSELSDGGERQKANFGKQLRAGQFDKCLAKIEVAGIGKGRFAQRLATASVFGNVPKYVEDAIKAIVEMTKPK